MCRNTATFENGLSWLFLSFFYVCKKKVKLYADTEESETGHEILNWEEWDPLKCQRGERDGWPEKCTKIAEQYTLSQPELKSHDFKEAAACFIVIFYLCSPEHQYK